MNVPLLDLKAQYATIKDEIKPVVDNVLESQQFILGPEVEALEREIAKFSGTRFGIGVSSGTDALLLALMAEQIGSGAEVITTPYTFFATAGSIARLGAVPVFVDIDPKTYNINPALIEEKITSKTKAIIPVHLFGQCADMKPILEISQQYDVVVIEDAAQAIGAEYGGLPTLSPVLSPSTSLRINSVEGDAEGGNGNFWKAGAMGHFGCFSFFPSKNLGGFGDGGMVVTNDKFSAQRVKDLRMHGGKDKYQNYMVGINGRLDALQAAILRVKLKYLEGWSEKRRQHAEYYNRAFSQIEQIQIPFTEPGNLHIYNQYVIRVPNRDGLQVYLNEYHIGNAIYYPIPLHLQECFRYLGYSPGDFPESEKAAKETLALPVYPELTQEQQDYVIDVIDDFCGNK